MIETFSDPNPLSLRLLITILLNCDRFDWGEWPKINPRSFCFKVFFWTFIFSFSTFNLFLCLVYVYIRLSKLVLGFLHVFKHVTLLDIWISISFDFCFVFVNIPLTLQYHVPTLLPHSCHRYPCYSNRTMYPLGN